VITICQRVEHVQPWLDVGVGRLERLQPTQSIPRADVIR
jgi:hypothetical protein